MPIEKQPQRRRNYTMHNSDAEKAGRREWATHQFSLALDLLESYSHTVDYYPLPEYEEQLRKVAAEVHGLLVDEVEKRIAQRRELEAKRAAEGPGPKGWFLKEIEGVMVVNPYLLEMEQLRQFPPEKSMVARHFRPNQGGRVCCCERIDGAASPDCPKCLGTMWVGAYGRLGRNLSLVDVDAFVNSDNQKALTGYAHPNRFTLPGDVLLMDDGTIYVVRRQTLVQLHNPKTAAFYSMWYIEASEPLEDDLAYRAEALLKEQVEE